MMFNMLNLFINFYQRRAARRMFGRWSPVYEEEVAENAYSAADRCAAEAIRLLADGPHNQAVADIGIGTGLMAQQIKDAHPCRIAGLDFSEDMLAQCAGKGLAEILLKCDVGRRRWPLADGDFRLVASAGLAEYLTPSMLQHFLKESARILQQNGHLVFTYVPQNPGEKATGLWHGHSGAYLVCRYSEARIKDGLDKAGLKLLQHSPPFDGCVFKDGSRYSYRLITAQKTR